MDTVRRALGLITLAAADIAVLVGLSPKWRALGQDLAAPHEWVTRVGADSAAITLGAAALWCVALWLALGLGAAAGAVLPGRAGHSARRAARRLLPKVLLRAIAGVAGLGILLAPVAASAKAPPTGARANGPTAAGQVLPSWPTDTDPVPKIQIGWPTGGPQPAPSTAPKKDPGTPPSSTAPSPRDATPPASDRADQGHESAIRVRPGDSLWLIAARRLGPDASAADVAAAWPRWYAANERVIGDDPALIQPGQVLHAPADTP